MAAREGRSAGIQKPADVCLDRPRPRQKLLRLCPAPFFTYGETKVKSGFIIAKKVITGKLKCDPKEASKTVVEKRILECAK